MMPGVLSDPAARQAAADEANLAAFYRQRSASLRRNTTTATPGQGTKPAPKAQVPMGPLARLIAAFDSKR